VKEKLVFEIEKDRDTGMFQMEVGTTAAELSK
jgi:hypothetical protein